MIDALRIHYALILVREGHGKAVTIPDRMLLLSERLATFDPATQVVSITDRGRDKIARKGK